MGAEATTITIRNLQGIESLGAADPALALGLAGTLLSPQAPGRPLGGLLLADLPGLTIRSGWLAGDMRLRGAISGRHMMIGLRLPGTTDDTTDAPTAPPGRLRLWHRNAGAGDICVLPPGHEIDACLQGGLRYIMIGLRPTVLRDVIRRGDVSLPGLDPVTLLERAQLYRPPAALVPATAHRVTAALAILRQFGSSLSPRAEALLRDELLDAVLAPLADLQRRQREAARPPEPDPAMDPAYIVRLVEDYMTVTGAASGGELPDIETICRAFSLSRRSLARAFHDSLGIGPMTYIRLLRLSQTRRALVAARRKPQPRDDGQPAPSVTAIALGHGFTELGRFAVLYRRMFGETPSETLHGQRRAA